MRLLLPGAKAVFTVTPDNPRALDGESLAKEARKYADTVWYVPDLGKAVKMAKETAKRVRCHTCSRLFILFKRSKKSLRTGLR